MKLLLLNAVGLIASALLVIACGAPISSETPKPAMPDLLPYVPEGWAGPIVFDPGVLEFSIAWTNQGLAMAEDYSIVLLLDGDQVYEWHKPVIAPGSVKTQRIALAEFPNAASLNIGPHKLELIVDPHQSVFESDEENNSYSIIREIPFDLPDLKPLPPDNMRWNAPVVFGGAGLVYGNSPASADGGYFMAYSVTNSGERAAVSWGSGSQIKVDDLSVWGAFADTWGDAKPWPGGFLISVVPIWKITLLEGPLLLGEHRIHWVIDKEDSVLESNEENNSLILKVDILPSRSRTTVDQPDELDSTIHLAYVLPADGDDEQWDINGTIESIAGSMQDWLRQRANGQGLRLDSKNGALDITFFRLQKTRNEIAEATVTTMPISDELYAAGFSDPAKIYAIWYPYSGRTRGLETVCGFQTTKEGARFAFSFFERMDPPQYNRCVYPHTTMLHEVFHALGAVPPCAPNYLNQSQGLPTGHVDDDPNDLMYAGDKLGAMIELDKDRNDYFGHGVAGCLDLSNSQYLEPPNR